MADYKGGRIAGGRLLCLSAFSGIGGLDLGLERSGFSVIGAIESDAAARRSLALNRSRPPFLGPHDVAEVARGLVPGDLGIEKGGLALLAAGPPCQPFSKAAQWARTGALGLGDGRSTGCLNGLLTLIERLLPHAVLIENVPGFAKGGSSALPFLEKRLAAVNRGAGTRYRLSHRVLDAADFGVPQRRRRAIIVALRNGEALDRPAATHRDRPFRAWDATRGVRPEAVPAPSGQLAGLLPSVPEGMSYQYFTERGEGPALFGYRRRFWSFLLKLAKAEPAWTVPANPGPATGPFHWESRPLAPEEILRLQSFPGSWRLEGAYRVQVRQAGNATPPSLPRCLDDRSPGSSSAWTSPARPPSPSLDPDACLRLLLPSPSPLDTCRVRVTTLPIPVRGVGQALDQLALPGHKGKNRATARHSSMPRRRRPWKAANERQTHPGASRGARAPEQMTSGTYRAGARRIGCTGLQSPVTPVCFPSRSRSTVRQGRWGPAGGSNRAWKMLRIPRHRYAEPAP